MCYELRLKKTSEDKFLFPTNVPHLHIWTQKIQTVFEIESDYRIKGRTRSQLHLDPMILNIFLHSELL